MRSASVRWLPVTPISPTRGPGGGAAGATATVSPGDVLWANAARGGAATRAIASATSRARRLAPPDHGGGSGRRGRLGGGDGLEFELVVVALDPDPGASRPLAAQDELGEWILEQLLDRPLERASPQRRIEAAVDEQLHR